jgi:hypothetical protein
MPHASWIHPDAAVKKETARRTERRKNDEDIAERISGGVRVERRSPPHERGFSPDRPPSPDKTHEHRRRPGR